MAFVPQINIILAYLLDMFEAMSMAIYPAVKLQRWSGGIAFEDLDININDRAIRLTVEDAGRKPRAMYGAGYVRQRGNLVISVCYGIEATEIIGADKQGLESIMLADEAQIRAKMRSPVLFAGLVDQDYDRPVFDGSRRKVSKAGQPILEVLYDIEWKQPVSEA
jgi:hypothetical protein